MAAVIAAVDDRLRAMLDGHAGSKAYLQKGAAFLDLPSWHDCSPGAPRHDHLVAHGCNVGVRAVQKACPARRRSIGPASRFCVVQPDAAAIALAAACISIVCWRAEASGRTFDPGTGCVHAAVVPLGSLACIL